MKLELYTRTDCHLCEAMEQEMPALESRLGFKTETIPIDDNKKLEELFGEKVPVLAHGNTVICEYVISEDALSRAIKRYS